MKSSKLVVKLSVVTAMALFLSVGTVKAADEFKLWHAPEVGSTETGSALVHLTESSDKDKAEKWLVTDLADLDLKKDEDKAKATKSMEKTLEAFAKEPFKMMEALKHAREKAGDKFSTLKDVWAVSMELVDSDHFGGKSAKTAYLELLKKFSKMEKIEDSFLKDLFSKRDVLASLNITDKSDKKPTESPSPSPVASSTPVTTSQQQVIGEQVDDGALQRQAQQICDKFNGLRDEALKSLKDQVNPLKDALNDSLNKIAQLSQPIIDQNANKNKNEKGLEEILPGLLANALGNEKQNEVTPSSSNQQPIIPSQQRRDDNDDPNQLNQPLPEPVAQQAEIPVTGAQAAAPIRIDAPASTGKQEMLDAQSSFTELTKAIKQAESVASTVASPMMAMYGAVPGMAGNILNTSGQAALAKGALKAALDTAEARLQNAKNKLGKLDEYIDEVKEQQGLTQATREQSALEADLNQKQSVLQSLAPEQRSQMAAVVAQAKAAVDAKKAEISIAQDKVASIVKSLSKGKEKLQSEVSNLEGKVNTAQSQITAMDQVISNNMQQMMMQQQQPQGTTTNINRLQGFNNGGNSTAPRTTAPRIGAGALQSGSAGVVRGSLGAQK